MDDIKDTLNEIDRFTLARSIECDYCNLSKYKQVNKSDLTIISQNIRSKIASEFVKRKKCKAVRIGWRMIKLILLILLVGPRKFCSGDIHTPIILQCCWFYPIDDLEI